MLALSKVGQPCTARQTCEYGDAGYKYLVTFVTRTQNTESTIVQNLPFMVLLSFSSENTGSIGEVDRDSFAVGFRGGGIHVQCEMYE
jgi:hypothetical protein